MNLFNIIKQKSFSDIIDIIEWTDNSVDTLVWRFPHFKAAIKNGALLTVRETQTAVLVDKGEFADVYQPGQYELTTKNMPILTSLKGWKHGFKSAFKVDVYFVNTKQFVNMRWGTANPIMMRDPEFGPIRIRVFGSYCFRVEHNPIVFIRNVAGTDGNFSNESITEQLRNFVIAKFTDYLAESKIAALDLASNLNEFSSELLIALKNNFSEYGIELTNFLVDNISLPAVIEASLDSRTSTSVIGNMTTYTQMLFDDSSKDTKTNPSGCSKLASNIEGLDSSMKMSIKTTQETIYHVAIDGVQQGPFSFSQIQEMTHKGEFTLDTLAWTKGLEDWKVAKLIPSLAQLFEATPPPL